jgi:hypothetical protein
MFFIGWLVQSGIYLYSLFERSDAGSFKLFGNITVLD